MSVNNICPNCLNRIESGEICMNCGFDLQSKRGSAYLPYGDVIGDRYFVGKVLEKNGDGITYLGLDLTDNTKIRIREFYPLGLCRRATDGKTVEINEEYSFALRKTKGEFLTLWRKLAQLRGITSLVTVFDILECNSTVYAIAEYNDDITLRDYLMSNNGHLSWTQAKTLLMPVLACLKSLHLAGVCHMGISPYTLLVGSDGKVRVWGFSIKEVRRVNNIFDTEIYEGFVPIEAYKESMELSERFDVYSFGAVLYRTLIGSVPIDSSVRYVNDQLIIPALFAEKLPAYVINAITNSLRLLPEERTENIDKLRDELSATPGAVEKINEIFRKEDPTVIEKKKERIPVSVVSNKGDELESKMKIQRLVFIVIILAMIVGFACLYFTDNIHFGKTDKNETVSNSREIEEPKFIEVPSFIGGDKDSNTFAEDYPNLRIRYEQAQISYSPANKIISQSVATGTLVAPGTEIILSYYGNMGDVVMPDFSGKNSEEVLLLLGQLGLNNVDIQKETNDTGNSENTVARQSPEAGTVIDGDDNIVIYVWDKTETTTQPSNSSSQRTNNATSIIDSVFNGLSNLFS